MSEMISRRVEGSSRHWTFLDGSERWAVELVTMFCGRGIYKPGWRHATHVQSHVSGTPAERHIGYVESGHMTIRAADGTEITVGPGDAFEVGPGHDAWVVGDEPCVAIDLGLIGQRASRGERPR